MRTLKFALPGVLLCLIGFWTPEIQAQDAVEADPEHYSVEFENDQVRVLRIKYGPGEKSVMHQHPDAVAVMLTESNGMMTLPDGSMIEDKNKAGTAMFTPEATHLPQNNGSEPMELILVELKSCDHKMHKPKN
ncbi:cupin domain-containing protein [Zeaxanthinibacter enoshimensis]|uniref:Mannose-6-phosphate isomerase-like protein (Cupin superfamily) n=1 Tax=Zeaxanthinibacter enoshimensis TaxID=392009 RepID=A0A4R6THM3_9FLAO|nr:cytoplasmic protein [Zeaxanthinibacter enoshimensis]TDQ29393.1 mannose-6-phosphate isomerase-like protein (cupin superfamily) [Zeaxanthinibacter enoshimensis]